MANSKNNNPVLFDLYEQEIRITEPRMVYDGCIDMAGLPDSYIGVTVTDENNNTLVEIIDGKAPSEGEFKVDYKHGWLYVDPKAYYKQKLTLDFYSRGIELTPASRIYTIDQNGCVDINKTLQTYIDEVNGHCKFDIADKFENLESGDSFNVMFGKLGKWYEIYNSEIENLDDTKADKVTDDGFVAGGATKYAESAVTIGSNAKTDMFGVAIGRIASASVSDVAIGDGAQASGEEGVALGTNARATERKSIQLGAGTNSNERILQAYDYQVTAFDGATDTYWLNDVGKLSGLNTTNKDTVVEGINSIVNNTTLIKNSTNGFAGGYNATSDGGGAVGNGAESQHGFAGGYNAVSDGGGAVGKGAESEYGFAGGYEAVSDGGGAAGINAKSGDGFSGGMSAQVSQDTDGAYIDAIQLGTGTNSNEKTLQVYDYQVTAYDSENNTKYLKDVGDLSGLNTVNKSDIVSSINELNSKAVSSFNAVMSSPISITEPFSINSSGDWLVGYTIPSITISNEIFGTFILPTTYLEPALIYNDGNKYCYAQYKFNVDNPSGTLSETEISVDILYKNVKGNTNSYIEIEDGNIIASINIYLGEVQISRQTNNNNEYDYFGSASVNTESKLSLLCVTQISTLSTRLSSLEKRIALLEQKLATAVSTDALIQGDDTIIFDNGDSVI